jgi:hypothetical protein
MDWEHDDDAVADHFDNSSLTWPDRVRDKGIIVCQDRCTLQITVGSTCGCGGRNARDSKDELF